MTAGRGQRAHTLAWVSGSLVAGLAVVLWAIQLPGLATACSVPNCVWPRLSAQGFAALAEFGVPPWGWTIVAGALSLTWAAVPFLLGVAVARSPEGGSRLPVLWFVFALGPLVGVPAQPWLVVLLRVATLAAWFTLFALFPTGRFRPRWVAAVPLVAAAWTLLLSLPAVRAAEATNDPLWWALESGVYVACVAALVAAQIVQFAHADADDRRAIRLLLVPFGLFVGFGVATTVANARLDAAALGYGTLGGAVMYQLSALLTVVLLGCVAVATLRDEAYGVRIAIDRVLLASVAFAIAVAVYAAVALLASLVAPGRLASALAAVVTAVALAGVFGRIERGLGRLVYGDADDPAAVVAALDARVTQASAPEQLLPGLAAALAERLRFPAVRIVLDDAPGRPLDGAAAHVPLTLEGRRLGEVQVVLRPGQRRLTARDRAALEAVSGPVAAAATAQRLNQELRRSRLEVLIGRDDERRALRRRLHDEVGPTLALAGHRITAARHDLTHLDAAASNLADAIAQVREISRDLRPPALDELGLRAALASFAEGLGLSAEITAPERIAPGVVEVAAYRIAVEALLNAARHAGASRVVVTLRREAVGWVLDLDDDGSGMPPEATAGVGLLSMRERAGELGGHLATGPSPLGGTRVHAELPWEEDE